MTPLECITCWLCESAKFLFYYFGVLKSYEVLDALCKEARDALLRSIAKRRARKQAATVRARRLLNIMSR